MIIRETVASIISVLHGEFLPSPTKEVWVQNEKRFRKQWNFPNAIGSLDGKHIRVKSPPSSGSLYYNYKGFFSIVLLAIANADFQFTAVDIGAYGSESDSGILWRSEIGKSLKNGNLGFPEAKPLIQNAPPVPHVLLADDAFPLRSDLMKPYKGNFLDKETRIFNYRLSRARMTVENSFGILAARWRILHSLIEADILLTKKLVLGCVLLHNFLTSKSDFNNITADRYENGVLIGGNWREECNLASVCRQGSNNRSLGAAAVRERFKEHFNSAEGSVSWQDAHVNE